MKLSDWLPSVFVEGDGDDIQVTTKKFSQFPEATGDGIQGVGIKDGNNVRFELTTDSVKVNPEPFRSSNGELIGTPEELAGLENQRDVNNFLYGAISDIEAGDIDLDGYATEEWVTEQLEGPTQDEKVAAIEAQIQYRGKMTLDADDKPVWPADQTKDRGGWWAYPKSSTGSGWKYDALQWIFPHYGEVSEGDDEVTKKAAPKYQVGDIIQLQVIENEAGAGTSWRYFDTAPVFVEYKVEEVYYPNTQAGNSNNYYPAYRVSMSGPAHRYAGRLPNEPAGLQGDPSDAWIQWYPTTFAFGADTDLSDCVSKTGGDSMEGPLTIMAKDSSQARATKRVETLGVFSNSSGSALRLGTTRDRVYIGHDDTSFNGPIKIAEIQEKTEDEGILLSNYTVLAEEGTEANHLITKGYVDDLAGSIAAILDFDWSDLGIYTFYRASDFPGSGIIQCKVPGGAPKASSIQQLLVHKTNTDGFTNDIDAVLKAGNILKLGKGQKSDYYKIVVSRVIAPNVELDVEWLRGEDNQLFLNDRISVQEGVAAAIEFPETDLTGYAKEEWVTEQIDDCVKQSDSWDMSLGTTLGVNQLKPLDGGTPFVYYEPTDYNSTHPCGIVNRGMMQNYVGDAIDGIEFPEADLSGYVSKSGDEMTGQLTIKKSNQVALDIVGDNNQSQIKFWSSGAIALERYTGFKDNELITKKYVDDSIAAIPTPPTAAGSLVSTSFGCKYYRLSNSSDFTFYTQDSNNAANSAHSSTKYITIKLPSDFWIIKAGVVPAGRDMGYITITAIGDGKVIFSGQVISVSSGGATFKVDAKKDLWSSGSYGEGTNYLIRMESCFREA